MAGFSPSGGSSRERSGEHGTIAGLALCSKLSPFNQESDRARAADGALNMVWIERQFASYLLKLKIRSYFFCLLRCWDFNIHEKSPFRSGKLPRWSQEQWHYQCTPEATRGRAEKIWINSFIPLKLHPIYPHPKVERFCILRTC
jgi:hypothetical protein